MCEFAMIVLSQTDLIWSLAIAKYVLMCFAVYIFGTYISAINNLWPILRDHFFSKKPLPISEIYIWLILIGLVMETHMCWGYGVVKWPKYDQKNSLGLCQVCFLFYLYYVTSHRSGNENQNDMICQLKQIIEFWTVPLSNSKLYRFIIAYR